MGELDRKVALITGGTEMISFATGVHDKKPFASPLPEKELVSKECDRNYYLRREAQERAAGAAAAHQCSRHIHVSLADSYADLVQRVCEDLAFRGRRSKRAEGPADLPPNRAAWKVVADPVGLKKLESPAHARCHG